jgi:hypothetical protein
VSKVALEFNREYTGWVENLGDDDYYRVLGSGPVTVKATVVSDGCPDDTPALHVELTSYRDSFDRNWKDLQTNANGEVTLNMKAGEEYRLLLNTFSGRDITACQNTRVDYKLTLTVAQTAQPPPSDPQPPGTGPKRLTTKPKRRAYACLHQSQGITGFAEPTFRFTLRPRNRWIDRTTARRVTARWRFRNGITTLFSSRGGRLYRFAHFQDANGRYLVEHPRGTDPLICR